MSQRSFLTAAWRHLVMLNYEIEPRALNPLVPPGTELDRWDGRTFASVVGFRFLNTRVLGLALPFHRNFEELNLRFYVRRAVGTEVRRGVVFVQELVPRRAIALVARAVYNEPYRALPMRSEVVGEPTVHASYSWYHRGRWHTCAATATTPLVRPAPGSLEEFISEHYWGYTRQRDGSSIEYRVEHAPWPVAPGDALVDADFGPLYGPHLAAYLGAPASCFIADGSEVAVYGPRRLDAAPLRLAAA